MNLLPVKPVASWRSRWVGALAILMLVLIGLLVHGNTPGTLAPPLGALGTANAMELGHLSGVTAIFPASCSNNDPLNPYNTFDNDQCTWYAWERRHQIGEDLPSVAWGDAKDWLNNAIAAGYPTGDIPRIGAIVVCQPGACAGPGGGTGAFATGHVAFVEQVIDSTTFEVSEQNWTAPCFIDLRTVSTGTGVSFIYFLPDPPTPPATPTSTPTQTPTPLPICTLVAILPTPSPFPTETDHEVFLPSLFGGGPARCNSPTPTRSPTPTSSPTSTRSPTPSRTASPTPSPAT